MGKNMEKIISIAYFFEFFISNFASSVFTYFLQIIILGIAKKVENISGISYLYSLFRKITEVFEGHQDEDVESLDEEMRRPKENGKEKKDKKRKGDLLEDVHEACIEKRRKTLKSGESKILEDEDKEQPGKKENEKENHEKKDMKRKGELLHKLCDAQFEKKRKIFNREQCNIPEHEEAKDVSKNEDKSRRRKREDVHAANKDSWASESHNAHARVEIATKTRGKRNKDEEITDMVSQKQRFDDEDKLHRSIFVSNLTVKTRKKHLMKGFSQFGEVESVKLQAAPIVESKMPRESTALTKKINEAIRSFHAWIVFKNEQFANAVLSSNITELGGKHIRIVRAQPPSKKLRYSLLQCRCYPARSVQCPANSVRDNFYFGGL